MRSPLPALIPVLVALAACGSCGEDEAPSAPEEHEDELDRRPAPPPEGLGYVLRLRGGAAALEAVGAALEAPPLRRMLEATPLGSPGEHAPFPPAVLERRSGDVLAASVIDGRGEEAWVVAVEADLGDLGPGEALARRPGGPRGARWLGPGRTALEADGWVVASERPEVLEAALPFLLFTVAAEEAEAGVHARFPEDLAGGPLRAFVDRAAAQQARQARAAIAAERARHAEAPPFGDPEPLVAWLEAEARGLAAYLPDLGAGRASLLAEGGALRLAVRFEVREGSPLAGALAEVEPADPGFGALPAGVAWAWFRAAPGEPGWAALLEEVGGARLAEEERAALGALGAATRGAPAIALGATEAGPFGRVGARGLPAEAAPWNAALGAPWLRTLFGAALGCERPALRLAGAPPEARICEGGEGRLLRIDEGALILAPPAHPALDATSPRLGAHPDVARLLPGPSLAAAYLDPGRVAAAGRLVALSPFGEPPGALRPPAPSVLRLAEEDGALLLELRVAPHGAAQLAGAALAAGE
ncbi:MAG TPA: hypothetical protein RMH85_30600 [Polyangiaceae bacterium LLY-WYZ-15_(1-7)]|nr:hypothetical protein [Myxococcales bacterium]MAT26311.1 hypothetical protein [Sandaracinus sp.]MBJ70088.1 hypothetical protein [Sandaracinus sp.]HJL02302.1 hypothetical protein [Polyangiaceae bacterium LLY-WYZ-15_(1-7)]HJL12873.1 hypothetical protein [Polyangiaceae bacterium LLY-WYZ-15_(1-7)]